MEEETVQFILTTFPTLFNSSRKDPINIGLGTGRTIEKFWPIFISKLREFNSLYINIVPTSEDSKRIFHKFFEESGNYYCLADPNTIPHILIDGFDCCCFEDDYGGSILIKGGGGAQFREKQIALKSQYNIYLGDSTKFSKKIILPIEANPLSIDNVLKEITKISPLTPPPKLRMGPVSGDERFCGPINTENGNYILDLETSFITKDECITLYKNINSIPGVLDCGFFIDLANKIISN